MWLLMLKVLRRCLVYGVGPSLMQAGGDATVMSLPNTNDNNNHNNHNNHNVQVLFELLATFSIPSTSKISGIDATALSTTSDVMCASLQFLGSVEWIVWIVWIIYRFVFCLFPVRNRFLYKSQHKADSVSKVDVVEGQTFESTMWPQLNQHLWVPLSSLIAALVDSHLQIQDQTVTESSTTTNATTATTTPASPIPSQHAFVISKLRQLRNILRWASTLV
jgi:hypothetical protein